MSSLAELKRKCATPGCERRQLELLCELCYTQGEFKVRQLKTYKKYMRGWKDKAREVCAVMREEKTNKTYMIQRCKHGAE